MIVSGVALSRLSCLFNRESYLYPYHGDRIHQTHTPEALAPPPDYASTADLAIHKELHSDKGSMFIPTGYVYKFRPIIPTKNVTHKICIFLLKML